MDLPGRIIKNHDYTTSQQLMSSSSKIVSTFFIGPLIPFRGMEGERIVVSDENIATVSSSQAMWLSNHEVIKINLPFINTKNTRWTIDGNHLCIGSGRIDIHKCIWEPHPGLQAINQYSADGSLSRKLISTCWNSTGTFVAGLVEDSGGRNKYSTRTIKIFALHNADPIAEFPVEDAEDILIVKEQVIVLGPQISVWSNMGLQMNQIPIANSGVFKARVDMNENLIAFYHNDWTIWIVDTRSWEIVARGKEIAHDIALSNDAVIALDMDGHLHAACLGNPELIFSGDLNTGLLANQLAITSDQRLYMMGAGPVAVHETRLSAMCSDYTR